MDLFQIILFYYLLHLDCWLINYEICVGFLGTQCYEKTCQTKTLRNGYFYINAHLFGMSIVAIHNIIIILYYIILLFYYYLSIICILLLVVSIPSTHIVSKRIP